MGLREWLFGTPKTTTAPMARADDGAAKKRRLDTYFSTTVGFGTDRDPRMSMDHAVEVVSHLEARDKWRGDDMAKRMIEVIPREMMRQGFELKLGDKETSELVDEFLRRQRVPSLFRRAKEFERAYGGAALFPVVNDGADLASPLNMARVDRVRAIHLLEPRELMPWRWYLDINQPKFGRPQSWWFTPLGVPTAAVTPREIHESRLVIFPGITVSRETQPGNLLGWGDSVLNVASRILADYGMSWSSAAVLLGDFAQAAISLEGLAAAYAQDGQGFVATRVSEMMKFRSALKALVLDTHEKFERITTPVTGMAELMRELSVRVGAAVDLPLTVVMGVSPAGLNATGDADIRFLYDRVSAVQEDSTPQLEQLIEFFLRSADGPTRGQVPEIWSIEWCPLWQMSDAEKATLHKTQAEADAIYLDRFVVSPDQVATARFGGDTYSLETEYEEPVEPPEVVPPPPQQGQLPAPQPGGNGAAARTDNPYAVVHRGGRWAVINSETGDVKGEHDTEREAMAQMRALYARTDSLIGDPVMPRFTAGDRVKALVDHMPGMAGMVGVVAEAHAGAPPYYAVSFPGEPAPHKWLAENEIEPVVLNTTGANAKE